MGCDIHIVLERKFEENGPWVGLRIMEYLPSSAVQIDCWGKSEVRWVRFYIKDRNYAFFNDLCGVRGNGSSFNYEPRGLPDDASELTRYHLGDDGDLHSHSWLTMEELRPVLEKHYFNHIAKKKLLDEHISNDIVQVLIDDDINQDADLAEKNWRLVFAFDN